MTKDKPGGSTPEQYSLPDGAKELQDLIEYRNMNFAQGNIFKAQYRRGTCSHSDDLRDARKTLWFAQREVERLEAIEDRKMQKPEVDKLAEYMAASQEIDAAQVDREMRAAAKVTPPTAPEEEEHKRVRTIRFYPDP